MIKNSIELIKNLYGYGTNSYKKKGALSLEMVITFVVLAVLLGVMLWLIYTFIMKKVGGDIEGLTENTDKEMNNSWNKIFGENNDA